MAADHAGVQLKDQLVRKLKSLGHEVVDFGPNSTESVDYPDFAKKLCLSEDLKKQKTSDLELTTTGILICGSGQGMAMAANKFSYVRAALCFTEELAKLAREHNNANVLCLGSRLLTEDEALKISLAFMQTAFEGGRHERRVSKTSHITGE